MLLPGTAVNVVASFLWMDEASNFRRTCRYVKQQLMRSSVRAARITTLQEARDVCGESLDVVEVCTCDDWNAMDHDETYQTLIRTDVLVSLVSGIRHVRRLCLINCHLSTTSLVAVSGLADLQSICMDRCHFDGFAPDVSSWGKSLPNLTALTMVNNSFSMYGGYCKGLRPTTQPAVHQTGERRLRRAWNPGNGGRLGATSKRADTAPAGIVTDGQGA